MLGWFLIALAAFIGYQAGRYRAGRYRAGRYRAYRLQNSGEMIVRRTIQQACTGPNWHLLNNVTLPTADGTTQIDHVLVSRYGVFVIETKDYSGWIFGEAKSPQWTQMFYKRKFRFQNPLHQNYKHIRADKALLDFLPENQVKGAVIFTGDAEFKTNRPEGIFTLSEFIAGLSGLKNEIITENRLQFCVGRLECHRLALTKKTDIEHQQHLQRRFGNSP